MKKQLRRKRPGSAPSERREISWLKQDEISISAPKNYAGMGKDHHQVQVGGSKGRVSSPRVRAHHHSYRQQQQQQQQQNRMVGLETQGVKMKFPGEDGEKFEEQMDQQNDLKVVIRRASQDLRDPELAKNKHWEDLYFQGQKKSTTQTVVPVVDQLKRSSIKSNKQQVRRKSSSSSCSKHQETTREPKYTDDELQPICPGTSPVEKNRNQRKIFKPTDPSSIDDALVLSSNQREEEQEHEEQQAEETQYPNPPSMSSRYRRIRNERQKMVLHSATLAYKHKIAHPTLEDQTIFRLNHDMKHERMKVINAQEPIERTKVLRELVQKDFQPGEEERDLNSLVFGWDAITKNEKDGNSATIWKNVSEHLDHSVLSGVKPESLPSNESASIAFKLLQSAGQTVEDELIQSSLKVAYDVLQRSVFNDKQETFWAETKTLEKENEILRAKLLALELENAKCHAKIHALEEDSKTPLEQTRLALSQVQTMEDRFELLEELFHENDLELSVGNVMKLLEIYRKEEDPVKKSRSIELVNRFTREFLSPDDVQDVLRAIFKREDIGSLFREFMDNHPQHEKIVLLDSRPLRRHVLFWEVHWMEFCDTLWYSTELLKRFITHRQDIIGKLLTMQSDYLGSEDKIKRVSQGQLNALETLLNQFIDLRPEFLENALLRNRQVLRDAFESERCGPELISALAQSSPMTVDQMLDYSDQSLPKLLEKRSKILSEALEKYPEFLLKLASEDVARFGLALAENPSLVAKTCSRVPQLIDALVHQAPSVLACSVAGNCSTVAEVLRQVPDNGLDEEVFLANPDLLVGNVVRLKALGLLNIDKYRENCTVKDVQTDPIHQNGGVGYIKARPLIDIVGKRRQNKVTSTTWTEETMSALVAKVLQAKVLADVVDDRAGHPREPLAEMVYDHFVSETSNASSAKKALMEFVTALRPAACESSLLYWFGILSGATINKSEDYNELGIDFFLSLLCAMVPNGEVEEALLTDETLGTPVIPLTQAINAVAGVASMYWYDEQDREEVLERIRSLDRYQIPLDRLQGASDEGKSWGRTTEIVQPMVLERSLDRGAKLMKHVVKTKVIKKDRLANEIMGIINSTASMQSRRKTKSPFGALVPRTASCVPLLHILDVVMEEWFKFEESQTQTLVDLFKQSDTNGDGILDFSEFKAMVMVVDPHCDGRTVLRMFKMTGEETEDGEHVITPNEFVEVMRNHKYTGPALSHLMGNNNKAEESDENPDSPQNTFLNGGNLGSPASSSEEEDGDFGAPLLQL